jgi:hypothetical protein
MIHRFLQDWARAPWVIADPGAGGTISVGQSGVLFFAIPSANVTRILPPPIGEGQMLFLKAKGGPGGANADIQASQSATIVLQNGTPATNGLRFTGLVDYALLFGSRNSSDSLVWQVLLIVGATSY